MKTFAPAARKNTARIQKYILPFMSWCLNLVLVKYLKGKTMSSIKRHQYPEVERLICILFKFGNANDAEDRGFSTEAAMIRENAYNELNTLLNIASPELREAAGIDEDPREEISFSSVGWALHVSRLTSLLETNVK